MKVFQRFQVKIDRGMFIVAREGVIEPAMKSQEKRVVVFFFKRKTADEVGL